MPKSAISTYSKATIWDLSSEDEEDTGRADLDLLESEVARTAAVQQYNPFLYDRPGFCPFQLYGRKKRGRPTKVGKLIPVADQEVEKTRKPKKPRPPGVEVKRYLDELKEFTLADQQPTKSNKGRKRAFSCPKNRDFDPPQPEPEQEVGAFDIEADDQFRPCLFDFVQMDTNWKNPVMISDENGLPKPKIGRPRIHPVKDKIPGRKRGRPSKEKSENEEPKEKRPRGRPRIHPKKDGQQGPKPKMIFTFERTEGNEEEINAMIASGMVVLNTTERQLQLMSVPRKRGRPRIHPVKDAKEKLPGRKRGRPRVHPPKIKVPGRKRGRPLKPKVEGEVPKEKKPKCRPKQTKPKVIFSFEDKYDLSPEEMWKMKKEGVKLVDIKKRRRRRTTTLPEGAQEESGLGTEAQPAKIKVPGRKRGRPPKPKVEGEEPKEKKPRSRTKVIFAFKDKYDLSPEEVWKFKREGVELVEVKKRRKRRTKSSLSEGTLEESGLGEGIQKEKKKRGRKKKVQIEGLVPPADGEVEVKEKKKRGRPSNKKIPPLESEADKNPQEGEKVLSAGGQLEGQSQIGAVKTTVEGEVVKKKRGRKKKVLVVGEGVGEVVQVVEKEKKKRGRKKKCLSEDGLQPTESEVKKLKEVSENVQEEVIKKKRGRKKKIKTQEEPQHTEEKLFVKFGCLKMNNQPPDTKPTPNPLDDAN